MMRIAWRLADWPLRAKLAAPLVAASLLPLSILTFVDTARPATLDAAMMTIRSSFPKADAGIRGVVLLDGSGRVVVGTEPALMGVEELT